MSRTKICQCGLLASTLVLALVSTVNACLNDTSMNRAEQEFRSSYESARPGEAPGYSKINPWGLGALSLGGGTIAGSIVMTILGRKRQPR
jgi:hypothetical protein